MTTSSETVAKKNIQKLQRAIVDGLEDVKAQDIQVFNTEHLSPLFERVIVASGTSNRQTKALAASVRDAVREAGFAKPRTEGEENGEWIIIDCGPAVVHVMQPAIRQYYRLEDLWGEKPVRLKHGAEKPEAAPVKTDAKKAPAKKAAAKKAAAGSGAAGKNTPAKVAAQLAAQSAAQERAPAGKPAAKAAAKKPAATFGSFMADQLTAAVKPEAKKEAPIGGRAPTLADDAKITLLVKENPKREGCAAYERFNAYFTVKTVAQALAAGLTRKDLAWDIAHGHISVK